MKSSTSPPFRLPISVVLVVGFAGLVAVAVAIVLYLGVAIGRENTLNLLSDKAEAAIDSMVSHIDRGLQPIVDQALWISKEVSSGGLDIGDRAKLDAFMLGALAGTPQTAGIAIVQRNGEYLRYMRDERDVVEDLPPNRIRELDDAACSFNDMVQGLRDRDMIRETLGRYVPERVAESLLREGGQLKPEETEATVLFSDVEGFTRMTHDLGPQGTVEVLNAYFSEMVEILEDHGGGVTQFQGDGILATFNVPVAAADHADQALHAAALMVDACRQKIFAGRRLGINTGLVIADAVGANERLTYTVHGAAVNLAARLEALNKDLSTRILVAGSTAAMVTDQALTPRGSHVIRGVKGEVEIFELVA